MNFSKYTCPRCGVFYCSLSCYKNHDSECTEDFYKDQVLDTMRTQQSSTQQQRRMLEVLQQVHQQRGIDQSDLEADRIPSIEMSSLSSSSSSPSSSSSTIGSLEGGSSLADATSDSLLGEDTLERLLDALEVSGEAVESVDLFSILSPQEQQEFLKKASSGQLSHLVPVWEPWWTTLQTQSKAVDVSVETSPAPPLPVDLPQLSTLVRGKPSPALQFNVINILYGYAMMMRRVNGDWSSTPLDNVADFLLPVTPVLSENAVFKCLENAIDESVRLTVSPPICSSSWMALSLGEDVASLLNERPSVLRALADVYTCLSAAADQVRLEREALNTQLHTGTRAQCNSARTRSAEKHRRRPKKMLATHLRKLFFFQVWAAEQSAHLFSSLSAAVDAHVTSLKGAASQPALDPSTRASHTSSRPSTGDHSTEARTTLAAAAAVPSVTERLLNVRGPSIGTAPQKRRVLIEEIQ